MTLPLGNPLRFRARPERVLIRPNGSFRHVLLTTTAPPADPARPRPPIALSLVIDRTVLTDLTRQALSEALQRLTGILTEADTVAALACGPELAILQPAAPATAATLAQLAEQVRQLAPADEARGLSVALLQGALAIATDEFRDLSRVCLLTAGRADFGALPETVAQNAAFVRQNAKVGTSVFGLGDAYDADALANLALAGAGWFHHLDLSAPAAGADAELRELAATTASQVTIELMVEAGVTVEPVSAVYVGSVDAEGALPVLLGELPAGGRRSTVLRFGFEPGDLGVRRTVRARAVWQVAGERQTSDWEEIRFTYAPDASCTREPRNRAVMHWVGLHHAARARATAVRQLLRGEIGAARYGLVAVAHRLQEYAGGDPSLERALRELQRATVGSIPVPWTELRAFLAQALQDGRGEIRPEDRPFVAAQTLGDRLASLTVGGGHSYDGMTVFPVFGPSSGRAYQTLAQGLAEGAVEVAERAQPTVPELELRHRGAVPVFILEGEEVVGGQQNRIVNLSMLVAPHTTIQLPVSCVEQGRWNRRTVRFHAGEAAFYDLRKERYTSGRKDAGGRPWLAQDAVWRTVAARDAALGVYSPSTAMHDQYQVRAQDLGLYDRVFPYPADALGLVVALNGRLAGAEIFAGPSLAAALWAKLIRSYAMDAASEPSAPVVRDRAIRLLNRVAGANVEGFPAVALGENLRFTGNGVAGAALLLDDEVVHVSVFRVYET